MTGRRSNDRLCATLRLLTGVVLAAGVFGATSRPASAATTSCREAIQAGTSAASSPVTTATAASATSAHG